jgi:hypothetical protein
MAVREESTRSGTTLVGLATIGCVATGVAAVLAALVAWSDNDWQGGGLCLIAAALSFGCLLNVLAR